ncbi:abasic site processing protein HMCES [Aplysia californica]|uniref:Abasic site processing protein HMCES n=1 Tax=Aplysia californica TaxID=6500 RepID=A0ABM0K0S7_APLCA|nr:abasic site processing protein HMCES [Aplysia californica]
MCGRKACTLAPDDIIQACTYRDKRGKRRRPQWKDAPGGQQYSTSYNMAPGAHAPVLVSSRQFSECGSCDRVVMPMKWGLTPSWHKDDPYKVPYETNNCRMEGMLEKKTYKIPLQKGYRCVVLMDGFFEWKTNKQGKQPYFFHFPQSPGVSFTKKFKYEVGNVCKLEYETKKNKGVKSDQCDGDFSVKTETQYHTDKQVKEERLDPNENMPPLSTEIGSVKKEEKKSFLNVKEEKKSSWDKNRDEKTFLDLKEEKNSFWDAMPDSTPKDNAQGEADVKVESAFVDELSQGKNLTLENDRESQKRKFESGEPEEDGEEWTGQRLLTVAGVYDIWQSSKTSAPLYSYSVITVPSSPGFSWCHHRMPAILTSEDEIQDWLDSARVPLKEASSLIRPTEGLSFYPVTKSMNNSRYKDPDCLKPVDISKPKPSPSSNLMMKWLKTASPEKKKN